jgi:hypothetical protein
MGSADRRVRALRPGSLAGSGSYRSRSRPPRSAGTPHTQPAGSPTHATIGPHSSWLIPIVQAGALHVYERLLEGAA